MWEGDMRGMATQIFLPCILKIMALQSQRDHVQLHYLWLQALILV